MRTISDKDCLLILEMLADKTLGAEPPLWVRSIGFLGCLAGGRFSPWTVTQRQLYGWASWRCRVLADRGLIAKTYAPSEGRQDEAGNTSPRKLLHYQLTERGRQLLRMLRAEYGPVGNTKQQTMENKT